MRAALLCGVLVACAHAPRGRSSAPLADHHQHLFGPMALSLSPTLKPVLARDLVAYLDSAGIRRAAVLSLAYQLGNPNRPPVANEYERVRAENDWTSAQVAPHPDRFVAFCSVNPLKSYALDEIARCARDPRLRAGLKMHFGNSDVDLQNAEHVEQLRKVFGAANANRMAIVVHMHSSVTMKRPYGAPIARAFLNELLPAAPDVPVQIAHLTSAGSYDDPSVDSAVAVFVEAVARKDPRMTNVWFDVNLAVSDNAATNRLMVSRIRQLGVDRMLFGSDGAVGGNTPAKSWAEFRRLPLTDDEVRIVAGNVAPYMR